MDLPPFLQEFEKVVSSNLTLIMQVVALIAVALISFVLFRKTGLLKAIFSNWRLALLGTTGVILSLASGWTTWDGMRNFTREPLLSLMITFGIQGIMLIVAWLIGESFASGMQHRSATSTAAEGLRRRTRDVMQFLQPVAGTIIGILLFAAVSILILNQVGSDNNGAQAEGGAADWTGISDRLLLAAVAILLIATLALNAGSDIISDYLQALRVITRSAVLWVMFLACMATSVFFSFDSLFSTIFPQEERERAATLRAQNQVAGVVNDIGSVAERRRLAEQDALFQKAGWKQYEQRLGQLVALAREAPREIEAYFERKMRERQQQVARRQEEKTKVEGQQVQLDQRRSIASAEIKRLKDQTAPLAAEVERLKNAVFEKDRQVIAKNAEAEAEASGIGETAKVGRGPKYRELAGQLERLKEQKKNLELQRDEFAARLEEARRRIAERETELAHIDGEIVQLKGRFQTANELIAIAKNSSATAAPQFDPANGIRQLERAGIEFRQNPTKKGLERIQEVCALLVGAIAEVPNLKSRTHAIDCDPGQAGEEAARVFALNAGVAALKRNCIGGDKLPEPDKADTLFKFARGCVQDSGLPSEETDRLRARINYLELNRDDKAHRFVVTANAFQDGNKLSYLALAIAIAIDALVFMSGLFGANAVRSPLSDVPSFKGRTAHQLETVIDVALGPHAYQTASQVLGALDPITPVDGFTAAVTIDRNTPHANEILRVLNAGATIGAVRRVPTGDENQAYQVRAELFEYLSIAAKREFEKDKSHGRLAELERTISVALLPDIAANAEMILSHLHPFEEHGGYMAEINLDDITVESEKRAARSALNAGTAHRSVRRAKRSQDQSKGKNTHYQINSDFFKALVAIRGRLLVTGTAATVLAALPPEGAATHAESAESRETDATPPDAADDTASSASTPSEQTPEGSQKPEPAPEAPSASQSDTASDDHWNRLVEAIGINPDVARACLKDVGIKQASRTVSQALQRQEKSNSRLKEHIARLRKEAEERVAREFNRISDAIPNTGTRQEDLKSERDSVIEDLDTLLMFPGSGLIEHLIESIEDAAGEGLRPGEQELKNALSAIREHVSEMDVRDTESWELYAHKINELPGAKASDDQSTIVHDETGKVVPINKDDPSRRRLR